MKLIRPSHKYNYPSHAPVTRVPSLYEDTASNSRLIYHYSISEGTWEKVYNYNGYFSSSSSNKTKYNFLY